MVWGRITSAPDDIQLDGFLKVDEVGLTGAIVAHHDIPLKGEHSDGRQDRDDGYADDEFEKGEGGGITSGRNA